MSAKSDDRRPQIATVAAELFAERGFDATSIDATSPRLISLPAGPPALRNNASEAAVRQIVWILN
jgi:hypothetical protein